MVLGETFALSVGSCNVKGEEYNVLMVSLSFYTDLWGVFLFELLCQKKDGII
jgi:hypothetical protein